MNRDGSNQQILVPSYKRQLTDPGWRIQEVDVLTTWADENDEILVSATEYGADSATRAPDLPVVYKLNVVSGKRRLIASNPGKVRSWMADRAGALRIGIAVDKGHVTILYRDGPADKWTSLTTFGLREETWYPVSFGYDNRTLYVTSNIGRDYDALYTYDLEQRRLADLVFAPDQVDASDVIFSRAKQQLVGVAYTADRYTVHWLDPQRQALQAAVDRVLTNTVNSFTSFTRDDALALVFAWNDRTPGTYYLFDTRRRRLEEVAAEAQWINPDEMCAMKPIQYKARDGLTIHGYLTLPKGTAGKNLPLVVNPHGGPWTRDTWEFNEDVQFLANRGYAVLQMNFRGSVGYGHSFFLAGFKEWGQAMQDDVTDGVRWAIAEGIADTKRICIYGASYGGYATLAGLVFTPELYRCGIAYAAVTDLALAFRDFKPREQVAKALWAEMVGDPKTERDALRKYSPLQNVEKIRAPLLIAHGGEDTIVDVAHSRRLASALKKQGNRVELLIEKEEGHGFKKEENKFKLYRAMERFLKENLE